MSDHGGHWSVGPVRQLIQTNPAPTPFNLQHSTLNIPSYSSLARRTGVFRPLMLPRESAWIT